MASYGSVKRLITSDLSLPNSSIFAKLLQSCIESKSLHDGRRVHARLIKTRFSSEIFIQNRLIDAYAKCGCFEDAHTLFDRMHQRNTFTWNAMISALTRLCFLEEAVSLFREMPCPDQCSWNSMVSGFAQHDHFEEALGFFKRMHGEDFVLNMYALSSALSACAGLIDIKTGTQIHALISKSPFSSDVYMGSALIDMYSKCGYPFNAQRIFDGMPNRNVVSWNSLITCYEQNGPTNEALELFVRMMECGAEPDEVTLASVLSACAGLSAIEEGLQIHARAIKSDKFRDDLVLCNAFVDMYAKCGRIKEARRIFDGMLIRNVVTETSMVSGYAKAASVKAAHSMFTGMTERNVISWNALIAGYAQNGENEEALELFRLLKRECVWPTHYSFGNVLSACANLADLQLGRQVHAHVLKHGFRFESGPESDIFVGNSLVDMYAKCGSIEDGCRVFDRMVDRDKVSWNAMIVGYAQNGNANEALTLFRQMIMSAEKPDHVTMIGVLSACSHAGLVKEGSRYFLSMTEEYGLVPSKDHYTCMVDLLGRAGHLDEVEKFIDSMPIQPDSVLWGSLLAACKVHGHLKMGKRVAEKLLELDPNNSGPYVLLSNMYAELGRWGEAARVRKLMRQRGVVKQPGCSWIEIKSRVHVFMVKDKSHPQRKEIYRLLKMLTMQMKRAGYIPEARPVSLVVNSEMELKKLAIVSECRSDMLAVIAG
ncbi:pentatricopeptide repeat-containing protein At2g13600 [Magnolia sinica]|uniref:pentatricopeptide repeat-containing protein At2g13600 n=1 Tax=Magnolia sinica TaxID=86752 RepID=UPI002659067C|nr:pentatricopeptide repeat-containing protein At2g13600 [Magnolia sinica]